MTDDRTSSVAGGGVVRVFNVEPAGTAVVIALPGPLELRAENRGFFGDARVDVKEGETIDVTIDVVAGAKLVTVGCVALPAGLTALSLQRDGGAWDVVAHASSRDGGEASVVIPPGRGRWRVEHTTEGGTARTIAEGEFDATSGQTVTLEIKND